MCVCVCVCVNAVCVRRNLVTGSSSLQGLSELKLEFLRIVSDHEHFVSLNLPFPIAREQLLGL